MTLEYFEYPQLIINTGQDGASITPKVTVPSNYLLLVPRFYKRKGKEDVEEYLRNFGRIVGGRLGAPMHLHWNDQRGLVHIGVGLERGLDLANREFIPHNLGALNAIGAFLIANYYVGELLKRGTE